MDVEETVVPQIPSEGNKRKAPATEDDVNHRISVLARWAVASEKVFELEKALEKAKKMRASLEKEHPWIGQVKGIVRSGQRKANEDKSKLPQQAEEPPKKKPAPAVKAVEEPPKPKKTKTSGKTALEKRILAIEERNKPPRWNPDFERHTFDEMKRLDPNYLEEK